MANAIGRAVVRERPVRTALPVLARVGYAAEGVVYVAVGVLAALAAFTARREPEGAESALLIASVQTVGPELLWAVGLGLLALALWSLLGAVLDLEQHGSKGSALLQRASIFLGGVVHGGLGFWALHAAAGRARVPDDQSADRLTATMLEQPFGRWLLMGAAALILLFALTDLFEAWGPGLDDRFAPGLSRRTRRMGEIVGRVGVTARASVLGLMGWFLLRAAWSERPSEARGLEGTLAALEVPRIGPVLLGGVAAGLMSYGVWRLVSAMFARVEVE